MTQSTPESQRNKLRTIPQPEVFRVLGTRSEGLSQAEAHERLNRHGKNVITEVREKRLSALAANFTHLMAMLLWAGGLTAFVAGLTQLGIAIWMSN
jgi:Ca2+-transporting ATPase